MMSPCAFIIRISNPLLTLKGIVDFLLNRSVKVWSMNLHCTSDLEGILLVHCSIEKDKIRYTGGLLEKLEGVIEVESLQAHVSNLIKE
jgi:hypothetical protein